MKNYWNSLSKAEQQELAEKVGSSTGYLRLILNGYKNASFSLAKKLEKATAGAVTRSIVRPDIYLNTYAVEAEDAKAESKTAPDRDEA